MDLNVKCFYQVYLISCHLNIGLKNEKWQYCNFPVNFQSNSSYKGTLQSSWALQCCHFLYFLLYYRAIIKFHYKMICFYFTERKVLLNVLLNDVFPRFMTLRTHCNKKKTKMSVRMSACLFVCGR